MRLLVRFLAEHHIEYKTFTMTWPPPQASCKPYEKIISNTHQDYFKTPRSIILIDKVQNTYNDAEMWNTFIKDILGGIGESFAVLFCGYGSPDEDTPSFTPRHIVPSSSKVSIFPRDEDIYTPVSLYYTAAEYADAVQLHRTFIVIDDALKQHIFKFTRGHPGAVTSLLDVCANQNVLVVCEEYGMHY